MTSSLSSLCSVMRSTSWTIWRSSRLMSSLSITSRRGARFSRRNTLGRRVSGWAWLPSGSFTLSFSWIWCSANRTRLSNGTQSVRTVKWSTVMCVLSPARPAATHAHPDTTLKQRVASVKMQAAGSNTVESARSRESGAATSVRKVTTSISYSDTVRVMPA